jgi:uncharacterized protein (DUF433 family)
VSAAEVELTSRCHGNGAELTYPHIIKEPGHCGGKATIDDTRVRVNNVAWLAKRGMTPSQIIDEYPDLDLPQVHAALLYYYENRTEIEAELTAEEQAGADFERRKAELIAARAERERRR